MTVQLLAKDDSKAYDAEILAERWQSYIDAYVSVGVVICGVVRASKRRIIRVTRRRVSPCLDSDDRF